MNTEKITSPLSRIFLAAIFISAGISKFTQRESTEQYMHSKGIPFAPPLRVAAGVLEVAAGLGVALGIRGKVSAVLLASYLVPTSLLFHDFWNAEGEARQMELVNFTKNLAIIGGLLNLATHGSGSLSMDQRYLGERSVETPEPIDYFEIEASDQNSIEQAA